MENKSDIRRVNPVSWVPTLYFAMGMPFVVLNMVSSLDVQGHGGIRQANHLLGFSYHAAVDIETALESVPRDV